MFYASGDIQYCIPFEPFIFVLAIHVNKEACYSREQKRPLIWSVSQADR